MQIVNLRDAISLPAWRRPIVLLCLWAMAMPVAFNTWSALLNNFVIEVAQFDGSDIGWLHSSTALTSAGFTQCERFRAFWPSGSLP